jgi:hypothetical protein
MFMLDTLTDLKNNKVRKDPQSTSGTTEELQENLKKYLGGLSKKTGRTWSSEDASTKTYFASLLIEFFFLFFM